MLAAFTCGALAVPCFSQSDREASPDDPSVVHYGDVIDVDVVGSVEFDWRGTITPEGFLNGLDTIPEQIYALCRDEESIAADIAREFAKTLREPRVVVRIIDRSNRAVAILSGAVRTPQRFQIKRPVNLNELLIVGGGITDRASGEIVIFRPPNLSCPPKKPVEPNGEFVRTRQGGGPETINISISDLLSGLKGSNPRILSGDVITVLEAHPIYVIGGVNEPKQISARTQITLTRAIDSAGGPSKGALLSEISIFRRHDGKTSVITADAEKIRDGQAEDINLMPFDIVDVPQKGRDKRRFPPVVRVDYAGGPNSANLPLRIID